MADIISDTYKPVDTSIYKYTASLKYIVDSETNEIGTYSIKSIAIDDDYKNMNMPMIFMTVSIDRKLLDKIIQNQETGIFIFNMQKYVGNSVDSSNLYEDYINDKFIYFIEEDINKNDSVDYSGPNEGREDLYKIVTLGLLSQKCVNNNKKSINGIVSGKLSSIMYYMTSHLPVLIEPPAENKQLDNVMLPALNSTSKALEYLNNLQVFYPTKYRFFIDFDCAYLISSSGFPVEKERDNITTVFLEILNTHKQESKSQGVVLDEANNMYKLECDAIDCELSDNHVSDKSYSRLSVTNASGNTVVTDTVDKDPESTIVSKTRSIRISNDNNGIVDNMISSIDTSAVQLLVQKTDIDSSIITINKEYIVKADDVYDSKYNGRYILTRKRELYVREDRDFSMNTMLLFEKIPENKDDGIKVN